MGVELVDWSGEHPVPSNTFKHGITKDYLEIEVGLRSWSQLFSQNAWFSGLMVCGLFHETGFWVTLK